MQNIIPTMNSKLKLRQNIKIWDKEEVNFNTNAGLDCKNLRHRPDLFPLKSITGTAANTVLRSELKSYRICDLPLETPEEADESIRFNDNNMNDTVRGSASNIGLQFDMNAPVEPVPLQQSFVMDYGELDEHDFEDLNDDAMVAIERCKGLKRQPIVIEDMQPDTVVANLEYSYRPLDMIDQFWAGPSHWKFRQSRRLHAMSVLSRASNGTNSSTATQNAGQKVKVVRKKKVLKNVEVTLDDFFNIDENNILQPVNRKTKANQLTVQTLSKRWDSKKLKLPVDYQTPSDIFDNFTHAASLYIATNPDATFNGKDDNAPLYDYDNENDRNYCSRIADVQSDTETETNTDIGPMDDNNMEFDNAEMPPPPAPIDEIPDFFIGAPERIEKISIAFAKRAKVVDMKQLKMCSWNIISKRNAANPLQHPCFSETLNELPKVLSKTMAENMSMPLAFYAILHLCNDKGLILKPSNNLKDFEVVFVE
jgi:condensin complex subunit 2